MYSSWAKAVSMDKSSVTLINTSQDLILDFLWAPKISELVKKEDLKTKYRGMLLVLIAYHTRQGL